MQTLPTDLLDIITGFAYNARLSETTAILETVLSLKSKLHNLRVLRKRVHDFSYCDHDIKIAARSGYLDRFAYFVCGADHCRNPLLEFFVWFDPLELFDYKGVFRLILDSDWRKIRKFIHPRLPRNKHLFMDFVKNDPIGIIYFSKLLDHFDMNTTRSYPSIGSIMFCKDLEYARF